jgi:hypothetical protein
MFSLCVSLPLLKLKYLKHLFLFFQLKNSSIFSKAIRFLIGHLRDFFLEKNRTIFFHPLRSLPPTSPLFSAQKLSGKHNSIIRVLTLDPPPPLKKNTSRNNFSLGHSLKKNLIEKQTKNLHRTISLARTIE